MPSCRCYVETLHGQANSALIPLSRFGNWLLAHGGYAWKQYRRGKADEDNIYKMADVERALMGWIDDKSVTEKLQQRARARLVPAATSQ